MDKQMLNYILRDINFNLPIYIQEVLDDEEDTPDHSAVYVCNMIKCYIKLMNQAGNKLPYNDVKGYIIYNDFNEQEYEQFENIRKNESFYYKGEQFN